VSWHFALSLSLSLCTNAYLGQCRFDFADTATRAATGGSWEHRGIGPSLARKGFFGGICRRKTGQVEMFFVLFLVMIVTSPQGRMQSIVVSAVVSVRSHIPETTCPNFTRLSMHVGCGGSSVLV